MGEAQQTKNEIMVKCRECGMEVNKFVQKCPQCGSLWPGVDRAHYTRKLLITAGVVVVMVVIGIIFLKWLIGITLG